MTDPTEPVHASCVAIDGHGIMICGPSGSGKSDLALRLIDRGAKLISDDYINLTSNADKIMLVTPVAIAGRLEVRSLGIIDMEYVSSAPLKLKIGLTKEPNRFPMDSQIETISGKAIAAMELDPEGASAAIKVELALKKLTSRRECK